MKSLSTISIFLGILLISCENDDEPVVNNFSYDFEESAEGWTAGFSDFNAEWDRSRFNFMFQHTALPESVNEEKQSLLISGQNISDDLFMFIKKRITGLEPNHFYSATFEIELASQYPEESVGIGGSPGASVYLKAGGTTNEPDTITIDGYINMNIDKGGGSQGGEDMVVVGNVGIPGEEFEYQLIQRDNFDNPIEIQSDATGNLWVIVGTDSGFEGTSTLYYNRIELRLE
ncbi:hypothetical protein JKA74_13340 [Marivirga sp. S37H4]|uniref:Uncharacterized protein n=1 Tax=Marivirga aurantiaca TaxID=2802615 RepID=A0A935C982_9BACT|nr:hypothetical protein [Marivirga aurantiaca]MBK6266021.1 hypothetical protein [Marivirga aurantiaca]